MSECEVCGARASRKAKIEDVVMDVCDVCVQLGEEIIKPVVRAVKRPARIPEELDIVIKSDLGRVVKKEREKMGLTQEQLAKKLMLRASVITRIESGWEPPLPIVEKLERFFKRKFKEKAEAHEVKGKAEGKALTIGDIVEIKKK